MSLSSNEQRAVVIAFICIAPALLILTGYTAITSHFLGVTAGDVVPLTLTKTESMQVEVTHTSVFVSQTGGYYTTITTTSVSSSSTTITTQTTSSTFIPLTTTTTSTGTSSIGGTGGGVGGNKGSPGGSGAGGRSYSVIPNLLTLTPLVLTSNGQSIQVDPQAQIIFFVALPLLAALILINSRKR